MDIGNNVCKIIEEVCSHIGWDDLPSKFNHRTLKVEMITDLLWTVVWESSTSINIDAGNITKYNTLKLWNQKVYKTSCLKN